MELPKGVHRVVSRGREYFYFQIGRGTEVEQPRIRLPKEPQSPEFWVALRAAQGLGAIVPTIKTVGDVCDLYVTSDHFRTKITAGTREQYMRAIGFARSAWAALPADGLHPVHVRALLDELSSRPGTGNTVLGGLRALSSWGRERGHFNHSITEGVKPFAKTGGHKPWTDAQQRAAAQLTDALRRAYYLARYTGQRRAGPRPYR